MKSVIKRIVMSFAALSLLAVPAFAIGTVNAQADIDSNLCAGANLDVNNPDCSKAEEAPERVNAIIATVINIFSVVVGVVSVIMIIIGGLKYITSGGDSGNVTGAKNTILYAIIGLVIVALAQVIVNFVLSRAVDV